MTVRPFRSNAYKESSIDQKVSNDEIRECENFLNAILLCIKAADKDSKEIYLELEIDPATWSRIVNCERHFPPNKIIQLQNYCGNKIPTRWLALQDGFGLYMLEDEKNRIIRQQDERIRELETAVKVLTALGDEPANITERQWPQTANTP